MKLLTVITARGGSKRLPNKNLLKINNKSLLELSISFAKKIVSTEEIIVSTDSEKIAKEAKKLGINVPWLRPKYLSNDKSKSIDAVLHAVNWYQKNISKVDGVLILQPTSPFRKISSFQKALKKFKNNNCDSVISVNKVHSHPLWCFKKNGIYIEPYEKTFKGLTIRSQDLNPVYTVNGNLYLVKTKYLTSNKSFYGKKTCPLILNSTEEIIDIDTKEDLNFARMCKKKQ